ncbi:hypothetical protein, conserved [Eimeria praecox]|uniref:Uncharacterized protein n=1 Tax=Eimeria praecox TaxID=51316 RepID=U6G402_9EIME|nr:hypothetical protein, conserved [Eimeria praecox]
MRLSVHLEGRPLHASAAAAAVSLLLLSETLNSNVQKFVDKELLNKVYVHRILKGYCNVASSEQLSALWKTVAEGALQLATTKDGVEVRAAAAAAAATAAAATAAAAAAASVCPLLMHRSIA